MYGIPKSVCVCVVPDPCVPSVRLDAPFICCVYVFLFVGCYNLI